MGTGGVGGRKTEGRGRRGGRGHTGGGGGEWQGTEHKAVGWRQDNLVGGEGGDGETGVGDSGQQQNRIRRACALVAFFGL